MERGQLLRGDHRAAVGAGVRPGNPGEEHAEQGAHVGGRSGGDNAVEVIGISLRQQQRLPAAARAAGEVRTLRRRPVIGADDGLGRQGHHVGSAEEPVVTRCLVVRRPLAVDRTPLVTVVGGGHGGISTVLPAVGELGRENRAADSAAPVLQIASGVGVGRELEGEIYARLHIAADLAMVRLRGFNEGRRGDVGRRARYREVAYQVRACPYRLDHVRGGGRRGAVRIRSRTGDRDRPGEQRDNQQPSHGTGASPVPGTRGDNAGCPHTAPQRPRHGAAGIPAAPSCRQRRHDLSILRGSEIGRLLIRAPPLVRARLHRLECEPVDLVGPHI